jgi:hypothetical protein
VEGAAIRSQSHQEERTGKDTELHQARRACLRQGLPERQQKRLRGGYCPDGAVEVPPLRAFAFGREAHARQDACHAHQQNRCTQRKVGIVVDLLHVPRSGERRDEQTAEVEQGKAQHGVPREGVADAPVEGIWLVFVEAQDVRPQLHAG